MTSKYLDMVRGQRRRPSALQFTSKTLLAILAIISMGGSAAYWWGVQSQLTDNRIVAIAFTAILVLAPPSLVSFLYTGSPPGMLFEKKKPPTRGGGPPPGFAVFFCWQCQNKHGRIPARSAASTSG
jgi:hypothetical protein